MSKDLSLLLAALIYSVIYHCNDKAEFSAAITPVFSVTQCFRNHSFADLLLKRYFLLFSILESVVLFNIFVERVINFLHSSMNKKIQKNNIFLK